MEGIIIKTKSVTRVAAAVVVGAGILASAALPSQAAGFRAYDYTNYSGLIMSSSTDTGYYDVADDRTSSGINYNSRYFYGRSYTGWLDNNKIVYTFAPGANNYTLGAANNTIDFFYYK